MGIMKTPFSDAIETQVPKGSADNIEHLPSGSGSPITNSPFADALEKHVPSNRTGGLLPEVTCDKGIHAPAVVPPETGKTFKIG